MSRGSLSLDAPDPARAEQYQPGCHVLLEDTDLYETVPLCARDRAFEECLARVIALAPGPWRAEDARAGSGDGIGLLILDGLVIHRTEMGGHCGAELLGRGDLLCPWQETDDAFALPLSTSRQVLAPTRLAVLDLAFAARAARYPEIAAGLVARTMNRSHNLGVLMAIVNYPRIDTRLHTLFWHLAGRWGRMRADGVLLPLRLTHSVLADLIAARRPTVSSALADLSRRGVLTADVEGWHLTGGPPRELCEVATLTAAKAANQLVHA